MKGKQKTARSKRQPGTSDPANVDRKSSSIRGLEFSEVSALQERIRVTVDILKHREDQDKESGSGSKSSAAISSKRVSKGDNDDSVQNPESFQNSIAWLARYAVDGLWDVVNHGNGKQARGALQLLMNEIVYANSKIERLLTNQEKRAMACDYAGRKTEFPILLSRFNNQNRKAKNLVTEELGLGTKLPFRIRENTTYTAYNKLAMRIVVWIDDERSRASSIYLRVAPDLDKKEFCSSHGSTWDKVIAFHLDYFQSPEKRWKTVDSELAEKLADISRDAELARLNDNVGPVGDITDIPEFKRILTDRRDKNVKTQSDLFHRVKNKIIGVARRLMK